MEVWGGGYSAEDYKRLNQLYKKWSDGVPLDDVISISYIRDLCRVELSIEKSVISNGKPTESLLKQKSSIIKDMGLDPATLKKNKEASEGNKTFGKWIDDIEQICLLSFSQIEIFIKTIKVLKNTLIYTLFAL